MAILNPETIRVNHETLEEWKRQSIEENSRPISLVSVNSKSQVFIKFPPWIPKEQGLQLLEFAAKQLREQITKSKS